MKKSKVLLGTLLSGAVILSGCADDSKNTNTSTSTSSSSSSTSSSSSSSSTTTKTEVESKPTKVGRFDLTKIRNVTVDANSGKPTKIAVLTLDIDTLNVNGEELYKFLTEWDKQRDVSKVKYIVLFDPSTKKAIKAHVPSNIIQGTYDISTNTFTSTEVTIQGETVDLTYLYDRNKKGYYTVTTNEMFNIASLGK